MNQKIVGYETTGKPIFLSDVSPREENKLSMLFFQKYFKKIVRNNLRPIIGSNTTAYMRSVILSY